MGESATVTVVPGAGEVRATFEDRGMMESRKETERYSPSYYSVELEANDGGIILAEQSASTYLFLNYS